jgi:hypothetical protein
MSQADSERADDDARLERQVNRLVNERGALFDKAAARNGLSNVDQQRLSAIERELDECFLERRRLRAVRDARRFDDRRFMRRQSPPRSAP